MDERLRTLERAGRNDPASRAAYRYELERLLLGELINFCLTI
ncbi:MAG TPA: hypothetical protein VJH22_05320 [Candidatus Nanoarchaeia archaeon]|nr:hypothetical protein [Candidatus Nanoarchaeia archaeon]